VETLFVARLEFFLIAALGRAVNSADDRTAADLPQKSSN
jgi:hypothetical protein